MKTLLILMCVAATFANEAAQEFTKANNQFASSVYKETFKNQNGNFLLSPFSAETVLAFTRAGSKGASADELKTALHLSDDPKRTEDDVKDLLPDLKGGEDYTFHIANKMYVKTDFDVKSDFKKVATDVFYSDVESIDFTRKEKAAQVMNAWVEDQTHNKIQNLIGSDVLDNKTIVVLINALYFKANWSTPFHLSYSDKGNFYKTATQSVEVDFMHNGHAQRFLYYECHHLNSKFLELPFKGKEASMTIILPNERDGLSKLESQIETALIPHNVTRKVVEVALPKFKIESKLDLKEILQKLGVQTIFEDHKSDLSGIAGEPGDLVVSEVIQKSFIDVNEEGVEAAAATFSIFGVPTMALLGKPEEFIADHPFIFYIKVKGVIIFVGRVTDPSK